MLEDGGFVITWHSQDQDGDDWGIFGQRFDSRGQINGTEFQLNSTTRHAQQSPAIQSISNDVFLATWTSECENDQHMGQDIYSQRFDYDGGKIGTEFQVATYNGAEQSFNSMDVLSCGKYVLTWCSGSEQSEYKGIYGRQFVVIDKPYNDIAADDPDDSGDNNGCMVDSLTK